MTAVLLAVVGLLAAVAIHDAVREPTLRRLAARNTARRRGEAALVLAGCLLGAAIITSSYLVGDSLRASVRDVARTQLGPVDELVQMPVARLAAADRAVRGALPPGVTALPVVRAAGVAIAGERAEPHLRLLEMDVARARAFGGHPEATGLAGVAAAPAAGRILLEEDAARSLRVESGDTVQVLAAGGRTDLTVAGILPGVGLAGLGDQADPESVDGLVAPGTIAGLAAAGGRAAQPPQGLLLVSNGGGVFGGVSRTDEATAAVERALAPVAKVTAQPLKRDLLDQADQAGSSFTAVFGAIGSVAVIAGILLLVNVFVMLSDERKVQLGTLRALGLRRLPMVRAFAIEGALYAIAGAALGVLAGIGVGRLVVGVAARIFEGTDANIDLRFAVGGDSLAKGFAIGAGISLLTVWLTSARTSRLNIIRAVRDQPAPPWRRSLRRIELLSGVALALGIAATGAGIAGDAWFAALTGPVLAAAGAAGLAAAVVPARWAVGVAAALALAWGALSVIALPDAFSQGGIPAFVSQGVVMCAAGICLATLDSGLWLRRPPRAPRGAPGPARARLPAGAPVPHGDPDGDVRPGHLLPRMPEHPEPPLPGARARLRARHRRRAHGDHGLEPRQPVDAAALARRPGVAAVAPLARAYPEFSAPRHPEFGRWYLTGFDARLLARGTPSLGTRDPRYPTDRAAFQAVLRSPDLVIVPDWFLQVGGGTEAHYVEAGESIVMRDAPPARRGDRGRRLGARRGDDLHHHHPRLPRARRAAEPALRGR